MRTTAKVNDGQPVSYVDYGGDGPPVLLLHSYLMDADMFVPQVRTLSGTFRLIAMDERGHGSTPADGPFTYWDVARDALGLLDELGVDRAAVVGTSQGGFIALRMALLAPERVTALALLGTSGSAEDPEVAVGYRQAAAAWRELGPTPELLDLNAAICLGSHDATEWQAKWRQLSGDQIDRVLSTRSSETTCSTACLRSTARRWFCTARPMPRIPSIGPASWRLPCRMPHHR
ncbi:alpha/beta fold hydrolase [Nocardia sp. KC 131]|uniref:alpha/beta fold hydrolase n=1 Tax=Nocardia arseniciresistens TaxID=3392119 RepID=UPI00398F3DEC